MNTNLNGPIRVMQHTLAFMHKQQTGIIINVASLAGDMVCPFGAFMLLQSSTDAY